MKEHGYDATLVTTRSKKNTIRGSKLPPVAANPR